MALRRSDRGSTLVELVVASALTIGVVLMVSQTLDTTSNAVETEVDRSDTTDELRTALAQLDRQVRSGNLFYDPALETPDAAHGIVPGMTLRIYTQANANVHPDHPNRCVQWRIHNGQLQTREYSPSWGVDGHVTSFRTVAEGVVNVERGVTAFVLDKSQSQYGRRLLRVAILTNTNERAGSDARVEVSVTGRNTGYGFPVTSCDDIPPYD